MHFLLLKTHRSLNDEALHTLLIEVVAIANLRSEMTTETINDVQTHFPLSPSNLLRMKSKVFMPPPGSVRQMPTNANVGEEHNT